MQITISGRHMDLTQPLRDYADEKVRRITKYLDNIIEAQVILSVEKYRHIAEVTIQANGITINGAEQTDDMYSSIDKVMDKIERQLRKHKGRVGARKQRMDKKLQAIDEFYEGEMFRENPIESASVIEDQPEVPSMKITKISEVVVKPMSVDEAVLQLESTGDQFLLFVNAGSDQMNVVYRRKDGNLGIIEPTYSA